MKKHFWSSLLALAPALLFSLVLPGVSPAASPPGGTMNPYDLLGRVLTPIAGVFCPAGSKGRNAPSKSAQALTVTLVLQEMTGLPPQWVGARVQLAVQPPDRALIRVPFAGKTVTICRNGQEVWIEPRSALATLPQVPADALDAPAPESAPQGKKDAVVGLAPFSLPFPAQQLAFLPVLFTVKDAGEANGLRLLDARLMSELARQLGVEEWTARLLVKLTGESAGPRCPELSGLILARPGWRLFATVEKLLFLPEQAESVWEPSGNDVVRMEGLRAKQWFEAIARQINLEDRPEARRQGH